MLIRWLIAVGLALGTDYGAWRWSMSASSDIPALVTGLALALLGVAFAWLVVLCVLEIGLWCGRAVGDRRSAPRDAQPRTDARRRSHRARVGARARGSRSPAGAHAAAQAPVHPHTSRESQSDRLAA